MKSAVVVLITLAIAAIRADGASAEIGEREIYEAEDALLSAASTNSAQAAGAYRRAAAEFSGGMVVANAGGEGNYVEWPAVVCAHAGERELVLITATGDEKSVKMSVNGLEVGLKRITCSCADDEIKMLLLANVRLEKGGNRVRVWSDKRLPDLDRLDLLPAAGEE